MLLVVVVVKFGFFWSSDVECNILDKDEKQITCNMKHSELQYQFTSIFVYSKCKDDRRRPLWEKMLQHASLNDNPLCTIGDYNVITSLEKKV